MQRFFQYTTAAFISIILLLTSAFAQAWQAPAVPSTGHMMPLSDVAYIPDSEAKHKVLIHVTGSPQAADAMHPALAYVARTVNLYAGAKVPKENLDIVVVLAGAATPVAINNARYKKEFGANNPNLKVLSELHDYGVEIVACGQALEGMEMRDDVHSSVTVSLSALTSVLELQRAGYALLQL